MPKLFKLAIEEIAAEEPVGTGSIDVTEAIANAEELARTDVEIQQDIQSVEELMEEKQVLQEQVNINDQLLNNPDAVVTVADVEVSEECRNEVYYSLGYKSDIKRIKFSTESQLNEIKSNPRKYLTISNESIKDTIKKIWEKIKAFFKKIWEKIKSVFTKSKLIAQSKLEEQEIKNIKITLKDAMREGNIYGDWTIRLSEQTMNDLYSEFPYFAGALANLSLEKWYSMCGSESCGKKCEILLWIYEDIFSYVDLAKKTKSAIGLKQIRYRIDSMLESIDGNGRNLDAILTNTLKINSTVFASKKYTPALIRFLQQHTNANSEIESVLVATKDTIRYIPSSINSNYSNVLETANFKSSYNCPVGGLELKNVKVANLLNFIEDLEKDKLNNASKILDAVLKSDIPKKLEEIDGFLNKQIDRYSSPLKEEIAEASRLIATIFTAFSPTVLYGFISSWIEARRVMLRLIKRIIEEAGQTTENSIINRIQ